MNDTKATFIYFSTLVKSAIAWPSVSILPLPIEEHTQTKVALNIRQGSNRSISTRIQLIELQL